MIARKTVITSLLTMVAVLAALAASPPAVRASSPPPPTHRADRCEPRIESLRLLYDIVVLGVYSDGRAGCRPVLAEISYGDSQSANAYRIRAPFANPMRVDLLDFKLGGMLFVKARTIDEDGELSWWSNPRRIQLPDLPDPLPIPVISVEPAEYSSNTPWLQASWSNAAAVDRFEIEAYDADDAFLEGDSASRTGIRYRPVNGTSAMKFRVRGVKQGYYSEWSSWAYARRSD